MLSSEQAILQTLAYSAIFDFPLTKAELWQFLISDQKIEKDAFEEAIKNLSKQITAEGGFYALHDNASSIKNRKKNTSELQKKLRIAKRAAYYLSYIPTIKLIGISGGVGMGKAEKNDDIDFFVVTKKNTLFMTRIWVQSILEMLSLRRKRQDTEAEDKVCVNLLVDETRLSWGEELRDVYTAHEILHMKPLFERTGTYETFIAENQWVYTFFPNAFEKRAAMIGSNWKRNYISLRAVSAIMSLGVFEKIVTRLQKQHMKGYQTTETVTKHILAFHPFDYRAKTLESLGAKLKLLGLLTNK